MAFEVRLQQFSGPLQLLLEFIEKEDLPITEISLAEVTENYLRYLDANEVPPVELADFLVVATKLLLIKSKAILPPVPGEAEEDGSHLALQLKMYKEFVEISLKVEELYGNTDKMFCRERISPPAQQSFLPPPNVTTFVLQTAMQGLLRRLEPFFALQKASIERVVSVQQRIKEIRLSLKRPSKKQNEN